MEKAIVLLSGGMDSLVCAGEALAESQEVSFLHMNYGQKTSVRERKSFDDIADFYKVKESDRKIIDMTFLKQIGGSSLTDENIDVKSYQGDSNVIPDSYVPFRNSIILSLAVSWAEVVGATKLYIGANYEDSPGYPDCRPSYYEAFNRVIKEGTKAGNIEIVTPVLMMKKRDIVLKGQELKVPFALSWSCYKSSDKACGQCDSCALRLRGFREAGIKDPIDYK
ncbi:7-cyano-7-deazaguanine synthase QueC [Peredibacter starrii]|uniref:7-cyano-7-deazaguanine synthase n=1 Tax=Peredibacter starrii TaxID=28202 RepID=A0AAX4HN72_9BACT|nr:7-cyano-7-deazaguanine synthase QueC [Peredibacter starrii]WPU64576.1 7-cyano-7-deazaguanine synthase QueC [Peredibacter starrii]